MRKIALITSLVLICIPFKGFCRNRDFYDEDDFRFLQISIGGGGFFAGRHVANYYNGHPSNVNKLNYAFRNTDFVNNLDNRLRDNHLVGLDVPHRVEFPERMRYRVSTAATFRVSLNLSPYSSIFANVNQVNLTAADIIVLAFQNPGPTAEPIRIQGRIWGRESRTMLDVGFQSRDNLHARNWQWFYELGFNVTNTRVRSNDIEIEGLRQSIMDRGTFIPGIGWASVAAPESAWGIGAVGSFGWRYTVGRASSLDFGVAAYLQDINLTGYTRFHASFNFFARLNFLML
ncbi:MAG: hypothetical protein FWD02_00220 [Bacteroidales bacterium]|nr:hypothetical protein [Bacteroidales bacterium]